jgi:hypothetical protein
MPGSFPPSLVLRVWILIPSLQRLEFKISNFAPERPDRGVGPAGKKLHAPAEKIRLARKCRVAAVQRAAMEPAQEFAAQRLQNLQ